MGLLGATAALIEVKKRLAKLVQMLEDATLEADAKEDLLDAGYRLEEDLAMITDTIEKALVPENGSVALTFFPFRESGTEKIKDEFAPFLKGTFHLPSSKETS